VSSKAFYDDVADALTSFLPPKMRDFEWYRTSWNLKCWYGDESREHYEVQHIRRRSGLALEIGFHTEHKDRARNDEVLERLVSLEKKWRRELGKAPEAGRFIGSQSGSWRRISEVWEDGAGEEAAVDAAERLATYIRVFEPLRTDRVGAQSRSRRS
jgi:hypothetical protein